MATSLEMMVSMICLGYDLPARIEKKHMKMIHSTILDDDFHLKIIHSGIFEDYIHLKIIHFSIVEDSFHFWTIHPVFLALIAHDFISR